MGSDQIRPGHVRAPQHAVVHAPEAIAGVAPFKAVDFGLSVVATDLDAATRPIRRVVAAPQRQLADDALHVFRKGLPLLQRNPHPPLEML